ncbi:MAG: ComF family protein [Rubritalea sp.]|uniref:ComF family protein n=1 Tax=Rubritalea sp. TaxID=2109375 RepID=UPI0032429327
MHIPRLTSLLDYLYPPSCHHCDVPTEDGRYLCKECISASSRVEPPFCERCGESYDGKIDAPFLCHNCQHLEFNFLFARAALRNTSANHQLVVDFKYLKKFYLANEFALFCKDVMLNDRRFAELPLPVIIPVPLHWWRKWHRGFNQASEISRQLALHTNIPTRIALSRKRNTETQTRLGRNDRLKNLEGAFTFRKLEPHFKSAILVDDVFTTGSTATACAEVLKKHAPQLENIVVLTALRG